MRQIIRRRACLAATAAVSLIASAIAAYAQASAPMAGKTVMATVGFEAGNRVDLYGRILAPYLARRIPGQPNFVFVNRPGAGGVIALNEWNAKAEPNGLQVTFGGQTQLDQDALSRMHARYRPETFRYFGGLVAPSQGLFIARDAMARLHDKSKPPVTMGIVGSTLRTGYYQVLWGAAFLGWNVKWIPGYQSTNEARGALERGEIDMSAFGSSYDIDYLVKLGRFAVASQSGAIIDGKMTSRAAFGDAPVISSLINGKIQDPVARKAFDYGEKVIQVGMWSALPPSTPDQIADVYVNAFDSAVTDAAYKAEWAKIDPDSPVARRTDLESLIRDLGSVSPEALKFIQDELKRQGVEISQ